MIDFSAVQDTRVIFFSVWYDGQRGWAGLVLSPQIRTLITRYHGLFALNALTAPDEVPVTVTLPLGMYGASLFFVTRTDLELVLALEWHDVVPSEPVSLARWLTAHLYCMRFNDCFLVETDATPDMLRQRLAPEWRLTDNYNFQLHLDREGICLETLSETPDGDTVVRVSVTADYTWLSGPFIVPTHDPLERDQFRVSCLA